MKTQTVIEAAALAIIQARQRKGDTTTAAYSAVTCYCGRYTVPLAQCRKLMRMANYLAKEN